MSSRAREYSSHLRVRRQIHVRQLPDLAGVVDAALEAARLLVGAHLEPVLHEMDARVDHRLLDRRDLLEEPLRLLLGAEPHHGLDAGAVVPAPVEDHDLTGGGQVRDVPLHVHLGLLALGRCGQRDHPEDPRADAFGDRLDRAALAGGVPAFEDDADLRARSPSPIPAWRRAHRAAGAARAGTPSASSSWSSRRARGCRLAWALRSPSHLVGVSIACARGCDRSCDVERSRRGRASAPHELADLDHDRERQRETDGGEPLRTGERASVSSPCWRLGSWVARKISATGTTRHTERGQDRRREPARRIAAVGQRVEHRAETHHHERHGQRRGGMTRCSGRRVRPPAARRHAAASTDP